VRGGDGRALGALVLLGRNSRGPRDADARTLERAARLAALAVERRELSARLEHQATHDALTGLPNRALFLDRLQQALASAQRGAHMAAVMFIDLDRFKHINDTLGHAVGDALLREVSTRLSAVTRDSDTLARMGGDEFTLVAGRIDDARGAVIIAEKLLSAFRQPFPVGEHELFVTASLGVSLYPQDGEDAASLQRNADIAMYRAKAGGKNQYEFFQPEMSADAVEHLAMENDLRRAVERGEFELHYQPVLDLASGRVVSLEALLRWRHPARGLLHPQHFLPVAEESGLIAPIGEWALREACRQTAAWQAAGLPATRASVNVSALQMGRDDLREVVAAALSDAKLDARWLELEVSERVLVNNVNASIDLLGRVRELGVRVAIDDFGRGHSSLLYLHRLPVDSLKVEGTFVRALESSGNARPLVQAVVALAHSLKLEAVAESVENEAQLQAVRELGCDLAQGYLWSPALPAEQIAALLRAPGYRGAPDIN
jgi:diguanylate cyclase (GGDEF)-like protein